MKFERRQYQEDCIDIINNNDSGRYLIVMATGLGKTYIFSRIKRRGRMLILSHREELVIQPKKFFDCSFGIELNKTHSDGEEVVSASTLTLVAHERYKKFAPNEFDIIVIDEAHHSPAKTYRELIDYFKPRLLLGFTATPNRGDGVRLDDIYSDIIYEKNIKWGIENGYLSNVECLRVTAEFDLSKIGTYMGDYKVSELNQVLKEADGIVVDAYNKYARGATLIFTVSVEQAERLQEKIPNSVVVKASTPNRDEIVNDLKERRIDCIINCMVFTEGTDIPLCETIIIARPTKSNALYSQMVGRGLRTFPGKEKLLLIDVVGATVDNKLCTAPSLLGIDMQLLSKEKQDEIEGDLLELPEMVLKASDCPASWVKSVEYVELWAEENEYNLRGINWLQLPDGTMTLSIPKNEKVNRYYSKEFRLTAPDELGFTSINGTKIKMQAALDMVYNILMNCYRDCENIWNTKRAMQTWGKGFASKKQIDMIRESGENLDGIDLGTLKKFEASLIISRIIEEKRLKKSSSSVKVNTDLQRELKKRAREEESAATSTSNETEGTPKKNSYRSIVNYILWRFPRLKNKHNEEMLRIMYGHIPQKLLADDKTYSGLITLETNRIIKYGNDNPYPFDDEIGVLVEFSKLSYQLAMNHIKNRRLLMCSKAMIYTVRNIQYRLSDGDKVRTNELINEIIADFQYAGGNYSVISNRLSKVLRQ